MLKSLSRLVFKTRQATHRRNASQKIQDYIVTHETRKLHLGAGPNVFDGWLNTTLQPLKTGSVHLDVTKSFPMPNNSIDYIFSEHMIEHITYVQAKFMLEECFRVLKPNGRIRIATPDLVRSLAVYDDKPSEAAEAYSRWTIDNFIPEAEKYNPAFVINKIFYGWSHVFIYDYKTLANLLESIGFVDAKEYASGVSDDPILSNIEKHGEVIQNEAMNQYETLVIEAQHP